MTRKRHERFPAATLIHRLGWNEHDTILATWLGVHRQRVYLMRKPDYTLNWLEADKLAIRVGLHPAIVWPELWLQQATPVAETDEPIPA